MEALSPCSDLKWLQIKTPWKLQGKVSKIHNLHGDNKKYVQVSVKL